MAAASSYSVAKQIGSCIISTPSLVAADEIHPSDGPTDDSNAVNSCTGAVGTAPFATTVGAAVLHVRQGGDHLLIYCSSMPVRAEA